MDLFSSGVRPAIDAHLLKLAAEERDYGDYWSASSAGYCMRKQIFERLKVPYVKEDARKQRVFSSGHIFHEWIQGITKETGLSIAQELELQDEDLMIRGHIDDLVLVESAQESEGGVLVSPHLILYDYKTQNSRAFSYKRPAMSHYHRMQLGTYMYMLRKNKIIYNDKTWSANAKNLVMELVWSLSEARILKISKDDLRMSEEQLLWTPKLEKDVVDYWTTLNGYWKAKTIPKCTCSDYEGGFMAREAYNPFYYDGEPCSLKWYQENKK
jgi:hypothetical protein